MSSPPPPHSSRDTALVFVAKTVRTFCYGFLGVLLPIHLSNLGMSTMGVGLSVTLTLVGSAVLTYGIRRPVERYGSRVTLLGLAALSLVAAVLMLTSHNPWLVVLAAMIGNVAVGTGETGPFLSIEQVLIARATPFEKRTSVLSYYNFIGYAAAAAGSAILGLGPTAGLLFGIFLAGSVVQLVVFRMLPVQHIEAKTRSGGLIPKSPTIRKIAGLFSIDSFGGGFITQSLVAYYFHERFGLTLATLGVVFFASQVLSAISLLLAPLLARRIGLLNTMVSTHLVSNVFLIAIAFSPLPWLAIALYLGRQLLSQMDVPTRQAYLMAIVEDDEREEAAISTTLARTVTQAVSPSIAGWVMSTAALSAPFVFGGVIKSIYDVAIWQVFRKVPLRESG